MKVLITGISGFIGKNCIDHFPDNIDIVGIYNSSISIQGFINKKKNNIKLYQCDLTNKTEVKKLFSQIGNHFDYCIYLASNVDISLSITNPGLDLLLNANSLINTLENSSYSKFIYMSTAGVYDGLIGNVNSNSKLNPKNPYCISKATTEQYVKYYKTINNIENYSILRLGGAYGMYSEKKFITQLVKNIAIENKKIISIYGDGQDIIKAIYVKDLINGLLHCLNSDVNNITSNIGQYSFTIEEIVKRIAKIFSSDIKIEYKKKNALQKYVRFEEDNDFNSIFNFKYKYDFESGIKEFYQLLINTNN